MLGPLLFSPYIDDSPSERPSVYVQMYTDDTDDPLYNQALKTLHRKADSYHHCLILKKCNLFTCENLRHFNEACLIFKVLHGLVPPLLSRFIKIMQTE